MYVYLHMNTYTSVFLIVFVCIYKIYIHMHTKHFINHFNCLKYVMWILFLSCFGLRENGFLPALDACSHVDAGSRLTDRLADVLCDTTSHGSLLCRRFSCCVGTCSCWAYAVRILSSYFWTSAALSCFHSNQVSD